MTDQVYNKKYYQKNRDKRLAYQKEYYRKNKKKIKEYQREYAKTRFFPKRDQTHEVSFTVVFD